jgi:hypothetical protein
MFIHFKIAENVDLCVVAPVDNLGCPKPGMISAGLGHPRSQTQHINQHFQQF